MPNKNSNRDLTQSIERVRTLLHQTENRGIQREIARAEGVSDQRISQLIAKGNPRILTLAMNKITERAKARSVAMNEAREQLALAFDQLGNC